MWIVPRSAFELSLSCTALCFPSTCLCGFLLASWRPSPSLCFCLHEATFQHRCLMGGDKPKAVNCLLSITPHPPYPIYKKTNDIWNWITYKIRKKKKQIILVLIIYDQTQQTNPKWGEISWYVEKCVSVYVALLYYCGRQLAQNKTIRSYIGSTFFSKYQHAWKQWMVSLLCYDFSWETHYKLKIARFRWYLLTDSLL